MKCVGERDAQASCRTGRMLRKKKLTSRSIFFLVYHRLTADYPQSHLNVAPFSVHNE
ncbi:hypothetical protein FH063_002409 [Azospirillum argentinense]|uniref:Uncharacterized protein n=1 Tax=Azospirillum argentinense TaxID=2970906 RepID=A0A5B0KMC6_9PROT|nr:hypothetical protein FH063_002409 [Azospirillum argentinense]